MIFEKAFRERHRPFIGVFRRFARMQLRIKGYSKKQATGMVNKLGDGKILEFIKKWGPVLWKIFMAILPLLLMFEPAPPAGPPVDVLSDEFTEMQDLMGGLELKDMAEPLLESVDDD